MRSFVVVEGDDAGQFLSAGLACRDGHPIEPFCLQYAVSTLGNSIFQRVGTLRHTDLRSPAFKDSQPDFFL